MTHLIKRSGDTKYEIPQLSLPFLSLNQMANGKRLAVIIGNSEYDDLEMLKNATNDARAVGKKLRDLGYETFIKLNLTRRRTFEHFEAVLATWKRDASEIVYFYAGHGAAIGRLYRLLGISCDVYEG